MSAHGRLLVRAPSWVGDFVMAEPTLRELHARWGARMSIAAPGRFFTLCEDRFAGAQRLALEDGEPSPRWRGHDIALLLSNSLRSALAALRAGIPRRVGWIRDLRGVFLTDGLAPALERGAAPLGVGRPGRLPRVLPRPFGAACGEIAALLGVHVRDRRPQIEPGRAALEHVERRLAELGLASGEPYALACVGARPHSAKAFPPLAWCQALDAFAAASGLPVAIACGPAEEWLASEVVGHLRVARAVLIADPPADLMQLAALARRAAVVLCADSGSRHVAQAVGAKVAVVAGPTDPRHTADHLERTRIVREVVPCGPCHREACPLQDERAHQCMKRIDPGEFAAAALALLR